MIENTSDRDPMLHFAGALGGTDRYITEMEAAGQRQLVNSVKLPTEGSEQLAELGFTLGPIDDRDDLFRDVTLPDGWSKQASDHDMWSYVHDQHGRRRVSVFYKAAFYDRRAFLRVNTVESYAYEVIHGETSMLLDDEWATREAMLAAFQKARTSAEETLPYDTDGFYANQVKRCDELIAELGGSS